MGLHWAEHSLEIAAAPEQCFDAIVDYETFPRWQNAVEEAEILERNRQKLGELVRFKVDGKVRKIGYTLRYQYHRPGRITWDFVEGDGVKEIEGEYTFEDTGRGTTVAKYRLGVDPGRGVPGPVAKRMNKQVIKRSVEDLKEETERRVGAKTTVIGAADVERAKAGAADPSAPIEPDAPFIDETGIYSLDQTPDDTWGPGPMDRVVKPIFDGIGRLFSLGSKAAGKASGAAGEVTGRVGKIIGRGEKDESEHSSGRDDV